MCKLKTQRMLAVENLVVRFIKRIKSTHLQATKVSACSTFAPSILLKTTSFNYGFKWNVVLDIETSTRKQLYFTLRKETMHSHTIWLKIHFLMKAESNLLRAEC